MATMKSLLTLLLIIVLSGCIHNIAAQGKTFKITFDTDNINLQGLRGSKTSLRSVSYEFCIPTNEDIAKQVKIIDHSVELHNEARGRINCSETETLAIGNTQQPQWKSVLLNLSSQDYITEIQETFFE